MVVISKNQEKIVFNLNWVELNRAELNWAEMSELSWTELSQNDLNKGLESDPSNSPPAQEHFTTILNFHCIQSYFLF